MSWFFGGDDSNKDSGSSQSTSSYTDSSSFGHDSHTEFAAPSSMGMPSGGGMGAGGFEQTLMQEQQKALIQAIMFKLTDMSFEQCVTKPSSALSSSEKSCIHAITTKYLDTSEIIVSAMSGSQN